MTSQDKLLSPREAAQFLGIGTKTLATWRSEPRPGSRYNLPFVRVGRLIRYRLKDIEAYIDSTTETVSA